MEVVFQLLQFCIEVKDAILLANLSRLTKNIHLSHDC